MCYLDPRLYASRYDMTGIHGRCGPIMHTSCKRVILPSGHLGMTETQDDDAHRTRSQKSIHILSVMKAELGPLVSISTWMTLFSEVTTSTAIKIHAAKERQKKMAASGISGFTRPKGTHIFLPSRASHRP